MIEDVFGEKQLSLILHSSRELLISGNLVEPAIALNLDFIASVISLCTYSCHWQLALHQLQRLSHPALHHFHWVRFVLVADLTTSTSSPSINRA